MDLLEFAKNTKTIIKNFDILIVEFLESYVPEIIDTNLKQLEEGYLSTGERTGEYSSSDYRKFKIAIGSISGANADLKVTGDFYRGFYANVNRDEIIIDSRDSKRNKLVFDLNFGEDIFGIEDKRLSKLINDMLNPAFQDFIKEKWLN